MRKVLLMVFAIGMLMGLGTTGAMAHAKAGCETSGHRGGNSGPGKCGDNQCPAGSRSHGERCRPDCPADSSRHGNECRPDCPTGERRHGHDCRPEPCPDHSSRHDGQCRPDEQPPPACPPGKHRVDDDCVVIVPPPADGPCSKADLVLLRALIKATGPLDTLVCLFVGDNAVNASNQPGGNCPGALIALPIKPLVGVCVLVPPAGGSTPAAGLPAMPALPDAGAASGLIEQIVSTLNQLVGGGLPELGS